MRRSLCLGNKLFANAKSAGLCVLMGLGSIIALSIYDTAVKVGGPQSPREGGEKMPLGGTRDVET